jgi:DNA-binding HxlR family transcriptional regulator
VGKRFDQYCPIAHALSLVGERWSLLIVRELMKGARRYTDLATGLPGIGTNILAARLRDLEAGGLVQRRRLPPPAASTVYELTDYGYELEEVMHALARWGARTLGLPRRDDDLEPDWGLNAFPALFYPERARGLTETYAVDVDQDRFVVRLEDGRLRVEVGTVEDADLRLTIDMATMFALASGDFSTQAALDDGSVRIEGDPETLARFFRLFSFAPRLATAPEAAAPSPAARVVAAA